jgi:hypothetical protein
MAATPHEKVSRAVITSSVARMPTCTEHPTRNRVAGLKGTLEGRLRHPIRAKVFDTVDGKKLA